MSGSDGVARQRDSNRTQFGFLLGEKRLWFRQEVNAKANEHECQNQLAIRDIDKAFGRWRRIIGVS